MQLIELLLALLFHSCFFSLLFSDASFKSNILLSYLIILFVYL